MLIAQAYCKYATVVFACVIILVFLRPRLDITSAWNIVLPTSHSTDAASEPHTCSKLPFANDALVVMKTGSTELQVKLPIHFNTTFRCYPNYVIYSDVAEEFHGHQILDSLEDVDPEIKASHDDFALYRRLQQEPGRASLQQFQLSESDNKPPGTNDKTESSGWKLDK